MCGCEKWEPMTPCVFVFLFGGLPVVYAAIKDVSFEGMWNPIAEQLLQKYFLLITGILMPQ